MATVVRLPSTCSSTRLPHRILCRTTPRRFTGAKSSETESSNIESQNEQAPPPQLTEISREEKSPGRGLIAGGAVGLGAGLFLFTRVLTGNPTFSDLEAFATPYDVATVNGKPTVVEFYAKWCEVCREMLPDTLSIEEAYGDRVNFVALNVENNKWVPEMLQYGVDGIPHFVFIDGQSDAQGMAIGRLPKRILEGKWLDKRAILFTNQNHYRVMHTDTLDAPLRNLLVHYEQLTKPSAFSID